VKDRHFIGSLTGLRFVAAATVAIGHGSLSLRQDWLGQLVAQISSVGMTLFFMLSGFVLWFNYAPRFQSEAWSVTLREFAIARFARLYPMYLLVALGIVGWLMVWRGVDAPSLGFILTMTQAWFPALNGTVLVAVVPSLQHLWSISVELFFYLIFPAFCILFGRVGRLRTMLLLAALNLATFTVLIAGFFIYGDDVLLAVAPNLGGGMQWLTYYSPYLHISQFLAGCIAAMIYFRLETVAVSERQRRLVTTLFWFAIAGLLAAPVALYFHPVFAAHPLWIEIGVRLDEVVCFSVILVGTSRYGLAHFLGSRPMVFGGECSYSIYLLHPFLIRFAMIGKSETPPLPEFIFRLCLFVAIATAVAWLTYRIIEAPARAWLRRVLGTSALREVLRLT
jgi:peptidoglycan/LPS O-acetylase OafA/YrhL